MNLRSSVWLFIVLVVLVLAACGPQPLPVAPTPIPTLAPATLPPAEAAPPEAEPEGEMALPAGHPGEPVFQANCAACHNLTAEAKVGPGLAGLYEKANLPNGNSVTDENLKEWILKGGGAMPGIALGDQELADLIDFLKEISGEAPAASGEASEPALPTDVPSVAQDLVDQGAPLFEANCSVCHNLTDETKVGPGLAGLFNLPDLPNGQPTTDENLKEWIRNGGGAMPGIPLADADLVAIVAFLRDATQ
jgi:mono/diheme cytochrome c family protein